MKNLSLLLFLFIITSSCSSQETTSLFNGKDLTGWHIDVPAMDSIPDAINPFIVRDGMLVSLGTPAGHIITDKEYKDYRLDVEYRDFWVIVQDIEVDNMVERRGPMEEWGITEGKKRRILNLTDDSENPVGDWNQMRIECLKNEIKVWVNGDLVNYGYNATADNGQIALQAEGSEVEFRKIELTPITALSN